MASAASSASFFSISARSTFTVSVTSWLVTSVAPSGSGMVVMSIMYAVAPFDAGYGVMIDMTTMPLPDGAR